MKQARLQTTVGVFLLLGLILAAVLTVLFSQGRSFQRHGLILYLKSSNVGGIKVGANVLLSGVQAGHVSEVKLAPDGKHVTIAIRIKEDLSIYPDARFEIEPSGFLGDQYIAVYPGENTGEPLSSGDEVECSPPFNMQDALRAAALTIGKIGDATTNLDNAVTDVRREVLNQRVLREFSGALVRFSELTAQTLDTVISINSLVATNALPVTEAISNLNVFAAQINPLTASVSGLVASNQTAIATAIKNIESASGMLTNLLHDLKTSDGLAGRLLHDEHMARDIAQVAHNLSITSSNLNRLGLWGILWKKRDPTPREPEERLRTPRDPFN